LPELIASNLDEYEVLATKLANDPPMLESIRRKLADHRSTCALFDVARACRQIEAAYATMQDLHLRGEPPRSFRVEPN